MSRVSRTTLEKRQLITIIGAGLDKERTEGGRAIFTKASPSSPYSPLINGCGCEAFAPVTDAARVAFSDGSFPAFIQTSCLVSYQNAEAAERLRRHDEETQAAAFAAAAEEEHEASFNDGTHPADDNDPLNLDKSSPPPRRRAAAANATADGELTAPANLSYNTPNGNSSPTRRETTLNPRASSMPIYVPDDAYDLEVDALEAKEAKEAAVKAMSPPRAASPSRRIGGGAEDGSPNGKAPATTAEEEGHADAEEGSVKRRRTDLINTAPQDLVSEVWTANADGTISIRNPSNGRHCKFQPRIPSFGRLSQGISNGGGNCYVTAMLQVRDLVFAGYVDGMVRAFNVVTKELVFEKRKHASTVTAMAQWKENIVFTASDDFRIMMWRVGAERAPDANLRDKQRAEKEKKEAEELEQRRAAAADEKQKSSSTTSTAASKKAASTSEAGALTTPSPVEGNPALVVNVPSAAASQDGPAFLHQLLGHASRIHALHVEGDLLFSGGDEGQVKCWDIRTRAEVVGLPNGSAPAAGSKAARFPILAHPGGVRDITSCQTVLITAGRGGVALFDMETCEEMKRFSNFADVNRVMVDPTSLVLWVCCSNTGTVTLIDLYTFREIGVIADFSAATIKTITTVATAPAARLFLGANGGSALSVAYCEAGPNGMRNGYAPVNEATEAKYKTLDVLRDEIFANEANLKSYRNLLWSIRDTDQYHKHKAAQIMQQGAAFQQQKLFWERCILFVIKHRHCSRQLTIASALERGCEHRLRFTALLKWFLFRRGARDARFKEFVTTSLAREHEKQLIGRQLQNVMSYMATAQRLRNRRLIAPVLEAYQMRRCIIGFFIKWRRWVQEKHAAERRALLVGYLSNRSHRATRMGSFCKLANYAAEARVSTVRISGCSTLERGNKSLLLRECYRKWALLRADRHKAAQAAAMASAAEARAALPILREHYSLLWRFAAEKVKAREAARLAETNDRIAFIEKTIADEAKAKAAARTPEEADGPSPTLTDAEEVAQLDEEIARLEREVEAATALSNAAKAMVKELSTRETALLLAVGTAPQDVAGAKAVPKRRAEAGEEAAEVGAYEGTHDLPLLVPANGAAASGNNSFVKTSSAKPPSGYGRSGSSVLNASRNSAGESFLDAFGNGAEAVPPSAAATTDNQSDIGGPSSSSEEARRERKQRETAEDAAHYKQCDDAMAIIKASAFNLRTGRAEIARRGATVKRSPAAASSASAAGLSPRGGVGASPVPAAAVEASFGASLHALFTAIRPLSVARDGLAFDDVWEIDEARLTAKPLLLRKAVGPAHDVVIAWEYIRNRNNFAAAGNAAAGGGGAASAAAAAGGAGNSVSGSAVAPKRRASATGTNGAAPRGDSASPSRKDKERPAPIPFSAIPNADIFIKNIGPIYRLLAKSLAAGIIGGASEGTSSPTAVRTTPLQTPNGSRNVSPNTSSRRTGAVTPARTARRSTSASPSSPAPAKKSTTIAASPSTPATARRTPARSGSVAASSPATKRSTTATAAPASASMASSRATPSTATRRAASPSLSRPKASPATAAGTTPTPATAAPRTTVTGARVVGGGAKPSARSGSANPTKPAKSPAASSSPLPPAATTAGLKKKSTVTATGAASRPVATAVTPRAGAAAGSPTPAAAKRSTTPTTTAARTKTTASPAASRVRTPAK